MHHQIRDKLSVSFCVPPLDKTAIKIFAQSLSVDQFAVLPRARDLFAVSLIGNGAKAVAQIIFESALEFAPVSQQLDAVADKKAGLIISFPESV